MRILIVDDTPTNLKLLRAQLEAEGHTVIQAHDGAEGLDSLRAQGVDAIISDILMPNMDGYRFCQQVRENEHFYYLPFIVYTSTYTSPGDEKLALEIGADKYIKKPATAAEIIGPLQEVISRDSRTRSRPVSPQGELDLTKMYNERLVNKLEEKCNELSKQAEVLRASEAKFRALVEQTIVGNYIIQNDKFVYVNPRMTTIFGHSEEDMTSRIVYDFILPEDHALVRENLRRRLSGEAPSINYQLRALHRNGTILHIEAHGSRMDYNGRPAVMGTLLDITERFRSQAAIAQLAAIVTSSNDAIIGKTLDGVITSWNEGAEKIFGYSPGEAMGTPIMRLIPADRHPEEARILEQIRRGETLKTFETWRQTKDGRLIEVSITASPIKDAAGNVIGASKIARDITDRRKLEAQFIEAQKMEVVGRLAGGVAHDFNNILAVIMGYSDLMIPKLSLENEIKEYVETIRSSAERAAGMTRQLLIFSRSEQVQLVVLDINEVIKELNKMLRRLIDENIELIILPGSDIGRIKADSGYVGQVLMNLVINARDAMPHGGKLTISTTNATLDAAAARALPGANPGDYVVLSVNDTGTGMTDEVKARIFEAFFTTKPKGKGTGLGLATCQTIMQQSGGHIAVQSEVGKGTTFKIYFPRIDQAVDAAARAKTGPIPRGTETIMVVEDEPTLRLLAKSVLEIQGYHVLTANNGQEALHIVRDHKGSPIRLVLTDIVMPLMSGKVMAEWLKSANPNLKILFTSGYTDDAITRQGLLSEGVDFLPKPYTLVILACKVREMLDAPPA